MSNFELPQELLLMVFAKISLVARKNDQDITWKLLCQELRSHQLFPYRRSMGFIQGETFQQGFQIQI